MKRLKKNLYVLCLGLILAASSCSFTTKSFDDPNKDKLLLDLISYVLERGHYNLKDMDDAFSEGVFTDFIEALDPAKRFFLTSDIKELEAFKYEIDNQIRSKDLSFFNAAYTRLNQRMEEAKSYYEAAINTPFEYTKNESLEVDYEKVTYANSKKELQERWRKQLKYAALGNYYDLWTDQQESNTETSALSDKEMEEKARSTTQNSMEEYFEFTDDLERKDYFAVFLNSVVTEFDPHTNYFAPPDRDRFDIRMSGKLEGIGARLQKQNDKIKIVEVISGGPAWRGEHVEVGDIILKVKQEDEQEPVSISGMRLDDAVKLIKGPKGTRVTLTIKRVDGTLEEEIITRDVVELQETYAKSTFIERDGNKYGLIDLPAFYFDVDDYQERNAATDVKKEILRLKEQGIEGLVLDLRGNGGGSLRTAIDIAGLFIKEGPVVQVAANGKRKEILRDQDASITWDGPLVILVNELSASASEILAAAIQDYKRGIIIGSKQSYGKGTVQNIYDLNRWLRNNDLGDMGALKVTTQKFYRVNGGSTQLEGVKSDIALPDRYTYIDIGERDYDNPLPYDEISPALYESWEGTIDFETTLKKSKARMAHSQQIALINENAKWIKAQRDRSAVPLNFKQYLAEMASQKEEAKKFEAISEYDNKLSFESLPYEIELMRVDTTLQEKRKRWHKNLAKDIYVEEAVNVLLDLKAQSLNTSKLAKIKD